MFPNTIFCLFVAISVIVVHGQVDFQDETQKPFPRQRYTLGIFKEEDPEFYYLPKTMTPTIYNILLEPFISNNTFNGNVTIIGKNDESITEIVLHALKLEIYDVKVITEGWIEHNNTISFDSKREFMIIMLDKAIHANSDIKINIRYSGYMNDKKDLRGLYVATYLDEFGVEKRMVTSHNEPTHARRIFPCFDEPALKANISLSIVRPKSMNSKTNMPLYRTETWKDNKDKDIDIFLVTPKMSTYLFVAVMTEYATISYNYPGQASHELHADIADIRKNYGDFPLLSSRHVLSALEDYTEIKYDLPKIGQVAIPKGFFGGAMENWGLVVYGEDSLLYKPNISTEIQRCGTVNIIAHEYAHQWFGNLVGPDRWAYTWLNEGFAAYFTMRIPTMIYPQWRFDEQFAWKIPSAMNSDARPDTRPMTMPVGSPENIYSTFDVVAYDKSASVIRMFEHVLGKATFRKALNIYLNRRQYKGATADDLISAFETSLQKDNSSLAENIREIFNTWHLQKGFPLVTAIRNYEDNTVTFTQKRYISDGSESDEIYSIPINYFLQSSTPQEKANTKAQLWLNQKSLTIHLPEEARDSFLILNKGYTGYYRVNYDEENWRRIYKNDRVFLDMPKNRVQLLEDAYTLAKAGKLSEEIALQLFSAIQLDDDNYLVIKSSIKYFDWLYNWYHADQEIMDYLVKTYRKAYDTYSHVEHDGDYIETMVRDELLSRMCRINDASCLTQMGNYMWEDYILQSPNLQKSVVCAGMMNTSDSEKKFDLIMNKINNEQEEEIRNRLMLALPCTKDPAMGKKLLDFIAYPDTNVLNYNVNTLMQYYCKDHENSKRALAYYLQHFNILTESYEVNELEHLLILIAQTLYSKADVTTIEDFLESTPVEIKYLEMFNNAINVIKNNVNQITVHPF